MTSLTSNANGSSAWRSRLDAVLGLGQIEAPAENVEGLDYFIVLYRRRGLVILSVLICMIIGFTAGLLMTPQYTATATSVAAAEDTSQGPTAGALSGLSFLTGHSMTTRKDTAVALLDARTTLQQFITQENLLPILFESRWDAGARKWKGNAKSPTLEDGYRALKARIKIEQDTVANLVRLNVTWRDSDTAAAWANGLIKLVNRKMQSNAMMRSDRMISYLNSELDRIQNQEVHTNVANLIQEQIKSKVLARSTDSYALEVIDPALPTAAKSSLGKGILMILGAFVGLVISVPLAFLLEAVAARRKRKTL
jgi:uncharacterized protein involved in exopolysaccharide biosynthesis